LKEIRNKKQLELFKTAFEGGDKTHGLSDEQINK